MDLGTRALELVALAINEFLFLIGDDREDDLPGFRRQRGRFRQRRGRFGIEAAGGIRFGRV